jgi:hypothetical protein
MLLGVAIMIALLPGELDVFGTRFDVHTMVYASAMVVVGYQAIVFAAFARIYAMTAGFLPTRRWLERTAERVTLEAGLLCGFALVASGVALTVIALFIWGGKGFGPLHYRETLRIVIPASTMLILGVQTVLCSFLLSALGIERSAHPRR